MNLGLGKDKQVSVFGRKRHSKDFEEIKGLSPLPKNDLNRLITDPNLDNYDDEEDDFRMVE